MGRGGILTFFLGKRMKAKLYRLEINQKWGSSKIDIKRRLNSALMVLKNLALTWSKPKQRFVEERNSELAINRERQRIEAELNKWAGF